MAKEMNKMKEKMEVEKATMAQQVLSMLVKQIAQVNPDTNVDATWFTGDSSLQGLSFAQNNEG